MNSVQSLQWLDEQSAKFALPFGRTKNQFEKEWPNKPHTLTEAMEHDRRGGNVGILTGKHSANIVAIDRDVNFSQTVAMLGDLGKTAKIIRSNAPGRGKFLYKINGDIPPTIAWRPEGARHPECEFLGDNGQRHALCPPSEIDGGRYELIDSEFGIQPITPHELDYIWRLITGGSIYKEMRASEESEANKTGNNDYVNQVKDAWTVQSVFEHFDKVTNGIAKDRGETRILGNGGLLISADGNQWYDHSDSVGGDKLDAWAWCKWGKRIDRSNPKMFWDVVNDMAGIKGIAKPQAKTYVNGSNPNVYTNGDAPKQEDNRQSTSVELDALLYRAEDGGILDAWVEHYSQKWLFSVGKDRWHYWGNTHWAIDKSLMLQAEIRQLVDEMNRQSSQYIRNAPKLIETINKRYANIDMPDSVIEEIESIQRKAGAAKIMHMATKRTNGRIASVEGENMARSVRAVDGATLDISESINLSNGTLNLHSLELLPHDPDDLFTYCLGYAYDPDATCPLFEKFIAEVLVKEDSIDTDWQLVTLFQELLGYSLTPQTKREVMIWMFGEGGNGKSVALSVIKSLLGPMAISVDFQSLGMPGNYDLADLPGTRVVFSTEAERGGHIAEGYIKRIVTGDPIKTRPIYGSPIDFSSTAKIWWAMNDKPTIKDTTDSIWRRMKLIPFYRKFEEGKTADVDLPEKLKAELPGILNWALRGLIRLTVNNKFTDADAANEAKRQYRDESNPVAQWINTMTVRTSYPSTLQAALYTHFKNWCIDNGERAITSNQFGRDLKRLKIECGRKTAGIMYHLALIESNERRTM